MGLLTPIWMKRNADPAKVAAAVHRIDNQEKLKDIAKHAISGKAKLEAVSRISDDQFLLSYVIDYSFSRGEDERQAAADRLSSKDALIKLLCHDFGNDYAGSVIAQHTAKRITDHAVLLGALDSRDESIRQTALEKLDDQKLYKKAACNQSSSFAEWAFLQIKNQEKQKELLYSMNSDFAFSNCLKKLITEGWTPDTIILRKLLDKVSNKAFQRWSLPYVVSLITDEKLLADIVMNSTYYQARCAAIGAVFDDKVLASIAMNREEDISLRETAFAKLQDKTLVDEKTSDYIRSIDSKYWSDEDKKMADVMAKNSY